MRPKCSLFKNLRGRFVDELEPVFYAIEAATDVVQPDMDLGEIQLYSVRRASTLG